MTADISPSVSRMFSRIWWATLLRGIVAILFGIFALSRPTSTLAALILLFGVYALVDGIISLGAAVRGWSHREDRWLLLLEGLIGVGVGIITLQAPGVTALALLFFIAVWALAIGVLRIVGAIRLRREVSGEFWMILSGLAAVVFAFLVMEHPAAGALAMIRVIGWFAIFWGAMLVMLSFKLRRLANAVHPRVTQPRRAA